MFGTLIKKLDVYLHICKEIFEQPRKKSNSTRKKSIGQNNITILQYKCFFEIEKKHRSKKYQNFSTQTLFWNFEEIPENQK